MSQDKDKELGPDAHRVLAELAEDDGQAPDIQVLLGAIWSQFGGAEGLAASLHADYAASPDGSATRARIQSDIMKLIHVCFGSDGGGGDGDDDVEKMEAQATAIFKDLSQ